MVCPGMMTDPLGYGVCVRACACVCVCGHCDSEMYDSYMCACSLPHVVACTC